MPSWGVVDDMNRSALSISRARSGFYVFDSIENLAGAVQIPVTSKCSIVGFKSMGTFECAGSEVAPLHVW